MDLNNPSKGKKAEATNPVPYAKQQQHRQRETERDRETERAHVWNNILIQ
jgi:hypothetical protein